MALSESEELELLELENKNAAVAHQQQPPPQAQSIPEAAKAAFQQTTAPIVSAAKALQPKNLTGLLPTAGMLAGTAILPGAGTAAGAGIGSIAQRMADLAYGTGKPLDTGKTMGIPNEAIMPMANAALAGIPETDAGKYLGNKAGDALSYLKDKFITKPAPKVLQSLNGKSAVKAARLINDPAVVLPESLGGSMTPEKATQQYGDALENAPVHHPEGYVTRGLDKLEFDPFSNSNDEAANVARNVRAKWLAGEPISAQEAYNAKRATDYTWPGVVKEGNKERIKLLAEFKNGMDDVLSEQSGHFLKASKDYARARLGADFTQILPRTKTGDVSTVKTLLLHTLAPGRGVGLLAGGITSPMAAGVANLGVQTAAKGINAIANNPEARQILLQVLQKLQQGKSQEQP